MSKSSHSHDHDKAEVPKEPESEKSPVPKEPEPASMPLPPQTVVEEVPVFDPGPVPEKPQPPLNFACLYYCTFSSEPWPDVVTEWGKKSVHNQYFLDHLKQMAAHNEATVRLIEALQRDLALKT